MVQYGLHLDSLLTPYAAANPTAAVQGGVAAMQHVGDQAQQASQFARTAGLAERVQWAKEAKDVQERNDKLEAAKRLIAEKAAIDYEDDAPRATARWRPIFEAHGMPWVMPGDSADLEAKDAAVRQQVPTEQVAPPEPGTKGEAPPVTTPDTPEQPKSQATGQSASLDPVDYFTSWKPPETPAAKTEDEALAELESVQKENEARDALPEEPEPHVKSTQTENLPPRKKGESSASYAARMNKVIGQRIQATPEPQPDESVKPPEEVQQKMSGPMGPDEFVARGSPAPISEDWKRAPVGHGGGPAIMNPNGSVFMRLPEASSTEATHKARIQAEGDAFIKELGSLYPELKPWADYLHEGIASGRIRTPKELETAEAQILAQGRTMTNAKAQAHRGGGGRDPTLSFDSGRKAFEDESTRLKVPEFEDMQRNVAKVEALLKKGDINSLTAAKYAIARINDPRGIVTNGDFANAATATLWEKTKDFFFANGPEPTLSPEEISRIGEMVHELGRIAGEKLAESKEKLSRFIPETPEGPYREGFTAGHNLHFREQPAAQPPSKYKGAPPL